MIDIDEFVIVRNLALMNLDMDYARQMMPQASDDKVRLIAMHKARYECTGIPDEYRLASMRWLKKRGYKRFDFSDFPDELPKGPRQ